MSSPLAVPSSPASSKRSRSRDSTRSSTATSIAASVNSLAASVNFSLNPSASAPSLIIPHSSSQTSSVVGSSPLESIPYPAFLRQSKSEIHQRFIDLEWEQRNRIAQAQQAGNDPDAPASQWVRPSGDIVVARNRYANVDPYLNNRVKLQVPEGHNDYINASPIVLKSTVSGTETRFIATQGPKSDITAHIWRMLWHETASPSVIVMLTQTHESGREKCHPYYPLSLEDPTLTLNQEDEFEDGFLSTVTLVSLTEDEATRATVRELEMRNGNGEVKTVWHLLFGGWPDFLVPEGEDRTALLNLLALSNEKNEHDAHNPRTVHCSAGVGRSGTFIALDWLLQELDEGSLDDLPEDRDPIAEVVDRLRQQRMMMVQGEAQFGFLYEVLREKWRDRYWKLHPEAAGEGGLEDGAQMQHKGTSKHQSKKSKSDPDEDAHAELEAELAGADSSF
ncbi:uncharacterized protein BDZ99DRAFT_189443 [Mytilinidion resinicola]|uniref:Uncharacterized protein n=1 Tax=Mytilinidion resinicola TaxID=574789 RepID=A0A6A6Z2T7_9PEZI|nr:uncharacterized protein BDZ99DRAFT_189443 [Mytilinidion resinicola]KAF2815049.1 hypothetical protein BDZ99DRAFT_189443 [Mytilinidion resinicola]